MTTTPINDTSIASGFNVDELTEGSLTGKGVLDVLLQTLRLHLDREFTSGRITGTAYATVYAQAITAFLAQAAQYALSKAKLPLELQLLEEQITLAQKQQDQITAAIRQSDYVTDFQLPSEVANKDKTTALLEYDLTYLKPVELSIAQEDLALKQAQTSLVEYDLTTIKPKELDLLSEQVALQKYTVEYKLPSEVADIEAGTAIKAYQLDTVMPVEVSNLTNTGLGIVASTAQTTQQTANLGSQKGLLDYDLDQIKPIEKGNLTKQGLSIDAQTARTQYETSSMLPAQVANQTKQTALLEYDLASIKPQELALLQQQVATQLYTVQTRLPVEVLGIEADNALKAYDLANIKPAELESIAADTSLKDYELTDIKPTQKAQIVAETSHVTKQELNTVQQTLNLGSQQAQIETETDRILYEITNKLPEEVQLIKLNQDQLIAQNNKIATDTVVTIKQGHLTDAQTCQVTAQTNQVNAEVALKLPEEVELLKRNQTMLTTQIAQVDAQTNQVNAEVALKLPEEIDLLKRNQTMVTTQIDQVDAQTNQLNAEVALKLPEEVELIKRNQTMLTTQIAQVDAETTLKLPAEISQLEAQTDLVNFDLTTVKPVEVSNLTKQGLLVDSQKVVADKQALNVIAETNQINYRTDYQLPEEVKVIKYNQDMLVAQAYKVSVDTIVASKQGALLDAQVCEVKASANKTNAEVALKLPEEVEILKRNQSQLTSQIAEIDYRTTTLMPSQTAQTTAQTAQTTAQTAQTTAQTAQVTYTTANVLPAQVALTTAQADSADAQTALYAQKTTTELAQTTTTPASDSVMGVQNALMKKQIDSYSRDAEQKAAKLLIDTWNTRMTAHPDDTNHTEFNRLRDVDIGSAVDKMLDGIGVV